jgi:hypothetical protein
MNLQFTVPKAKLWNLIAAFAFLFALTLNGLANILPINGLETGEISDLYANYFAPIGLTFSIWAVIYFSLAVYVGWRLRQYSQTSDTPAFRHWMTVDIAFTISSVANGLWILSWHYLQFGVSLLMMVILLLSLIYINLAFRGDQTIETIPFRIYFGWITIATVANVTTWIVANAASFQWLWNGGEVSQQLLTIIILLVTIGIGNLVILKQKDPFYGLVVFWALLGIYLKHVIDLPNFGISGVANTAFFGMVMTPLIILFTQRKKLMKFLRKS